MEHYAINYFSYFLKYNSTAKFIKYWHFYDTIKLVDLKATAAL